MCERNDFEIEFIEEKDFKCFLRCLELALKSNFSWCLDCKSEECIVWKSGIINKRY